MLFRSCQSLTDIQTESSRSREAKDRLLVASSEAATAGNQIAGNSQMIETQVANLDRSTSISVHLVASVIADIACLGDQISAQTVMVTESTASVIEILASLANMNRITDADRIATNELVDESRRGKTIFQAAHQKIVEISTHADAIKEIAVVIENVATQTNLLAMNAAIEAAHAGTSGRGFAIVAGEIRKFSEASTASSQNITAMITQILGLIAEALQANSSTVQSFDSIDSRIQHVNHSISELHDSIGEIQTGARQIMEAMTELKTRSIHIKESSSSMEANSTSIGQAMTELQTISLAVGRNIQQVSKGLAEINQTAASVETVSFDIGELTDRLVEEVGRFRTG